MNSTEELLEDSDSSDEDYTPGKNPHEVLSEVESDGDPEDNLSDIEHSDDKRRKRSKNVRKSNKKLKKSEDKCNNSNGFEDCNKSKEMTVEEKKKLEDDLWADFMKDTGFQSKKSNHENVSNKANLKPVKSSNDGKSNLTKRAVEKVKVTQVFEFAGEEVAVEKEVAVNSAEARLLNKPTAEGTKSKFGSKGGLSGISGVLSQLGKKPKISTLEKSKLDWDKFKKEENLEEELETHNKGKDGYLERQDFLQRADFRRFEIEKEIRTIERNRRMNNSL